MGRPDILLNVADRPRDDLSIMLRRVYELAVSDYDDGRRRQGQRTGEEILDKCAVTMRRGFHRAMASTVYNKTLWSLESADEESSRD